ncbi:MAG TPA: hypothetical protein VK741_21665 [Acetobacteraceae bacterium]|jgi:hypothetical protein|nr:hypothetical protein [Acetobacteraceae bacterium]
MKPNISAIAGTVLAGFVLIPLAIEADPSPCGALKDRLTNLAINIERQAGDRTDEGETRNGINAMVTSQIEAGKSGLHAAVSCNAYYWISMFSQPPL